MGLFRKKEVPVNFLKAKAGVFLERLYNGNISQGTYSKVIKRILDVEKILEGYPFYKAYCSGNLDKKGFLRDLHSFRQQLMKEGISWRELQEIIHQVQLNEQISFEKVEKEEIEVGNIKGTIFRRGKGHLNGIVLTHGIATFRYTLLNLAETLAQLGYLVLAIDLPKHNINRNMDLRLGYIAELIRDSVIHLRSVEKVKGVAVVGHSLGSVGSLLAGVGYTARIEREVYILWERVRGKIQEVARNYSEGGSGEGFMDSMNEIAGYYAQIKQLILRSLKMRDKLGEYFVNCCVMLSMPSECKKSFAGLSLLKKLPDKWIAKVWNKLIHDPQVKFIMKEGNRLNFRDQKTGGVKWLYLRDENPFELIDYFTTLKEPADFISLINRLTRFTHKDNKVSFIEYYRKKYLLSVPKLFIYGKWDLLLRPFMPGARKKLEEVYKAYGNAQIIPVTSGHLLTDRRFQLRATFNITNKVVIQNIVNFLNRNMGYTNVFEVQQVASSV